MAKAKTAIGYGDHHITIEPYQVKWMNLTLFEASCPCGWMLRGMDKAHAERLGKQHTSEPDVVYPSVIFDLKDATK